MKSLRSMFAEPLSAYLDLRRALGCRCEEPTFHLRSFDAYACQRNHTGPLTQELALAFALSNPKNSTNYCARRYQVVRQPPQLAHSRTSIEKTRCKSSAHE